MLSMKIWWVSIILHFCWYKTLIMNSNSGLMMVINITYFEWEQIYSIELWSVLSYQNWICIFRHGLFLPQVHHPAPVLLAVALTVWTATMPAPCYQTKVHNHTPDLTLHRPLNSSLTGTGKSINHSVHLEIWVTHLHNSVIGVMMCMFSQLHPVRGVSLMCQWVTLEMILSYCVNSEILLYWWQKSA